MFMEELKILEKLIGINSYDLNDNTEIVTQLVGFFEGTATEILNLPDEITQRANLLIGLNCKLQNAKDAIVLSGHIDTVFPSQSNLNENNSTHSAVAGKLYGLGSIDMKSFWAVILNNLEQLSKLTVPIVLAITCDEETDARGISIIMTKMKQLNIVPKCVIVGEPTNSQICSESKGSYEYEIRVEGKSCHSSTPQNGINANYILCNLVLEVEKLCYKYPQTTCTCNIISGGEALNIISSKATMQFAIRSFNRQCVELIIEDIQKKKAELLDRYSGAKIDLIKMFEMPPLEKRNCKLIDNICQKFNKKEIQFTGACEGGFFQELCDNVFIYGVGDLKLCHSPEENVVVSEFLSYNDSFVDFVKNVAEMT